MPANERGFSVKLNEQHLQALGIPQDVIDQAKQVGMDLQTLAQLCVAHTVNAARDFLSWVQGKLPGGKP